MPDIDQIRSMIREELQAHRLENDKKFDAIEAALTTGLDGEPGLIQKNKEIHKRVIDLEKAEATRNRTVAAAAVSVIAAIFHMVWQAVTGATPSP